VKACPICGGKVERRSALGRTPDYDSDLCRETQKLLWRLAGHLDKVSPRLTPEARKSLRATVWSSLNASLNVRRSVASPVAVEPVVASTPASK